MSDRFYVDEPILGPEVILRGPQARHLDQVMRRGAGSEVTLFDGSGAEFTAIIVAAQRHGVQLRVTQRHTVSRELPVRLVVAAAVPKGERLRWMIEKLTELGVNEYVPLRTERGIVHPHGATWDRLRRVVIEACKQCGRNELMRIAPPTPWADYTDGTSPAVSRAFGDPQGVALAAWLTAASPPSREAATAARQGLQSVAPDARATSDPSRIAAAAERPGLQSVAADARAASDPSRKAATAHSLGFQPQVAGATTNPSPAGAQVGIIDAQRTDEPGATVSPHVVLAVGPEGGFTPGERASAIERGWTPVRLGPRTLRIETAAVAWSAAVALWFEPTGPHPACGSLKL